MKLLPIGITFHFGEYFLPTKRHRKEEVRDMVVCHEAKVREVEESEFPVALRVTDYKGWSMKTQCSEYETIDLRSYDGKLWKECRIESGQDKGKLISTDALFEKLNPNGFSNRHGYMENPEKPYVEGVSVITRDNKDELINEIDKKALRYIIFDNTLWIESPKPFYSVSRVGWDGVYFAIEWTHNEEIDYTKFLATQRNEALSYASSLAMACRNDSDKKEFKEEKENIEVLIPEAYTLHRATESNYYKGYFYDDEKRCFVKEYGPAPAHSEKWLVRFNSTHDYENYMAIIYTYIEHTTNNVRSIWYVAGQLLEDVRDVSFVDIKEIYSVEQDMDVLKWINEYKQKTKK